MTKKEKETRTTQRVYRKPQIEEVRLIAEEAVLTGCKTQVGGQAAAKKGQCNINFLCILGGS